MASIVPSGDKATLRKSPCNGHAGASVRPRPTHTRRVGSWIRNDVGIDTTNPYNGVAGQNSTTQANNGAGGQGIVTDFIEEIQVKSAGYAAEFGGSVGGVVNVITKSGTNDFDGAILGYYSDSEWNGKARPSFYEPAGAANDFHVTFPKDEQTQFEPGAMIGGPIVRDRMWFFVGYNPTLSSTTRNPVNVVSGNTSSAGTSFDQDNKIDIYFGEPRNSARPYLFEQLKAPN